MSLQVIFLTSTGMWYEKRRKVAGQLQSCSFHFHIHISYIYNKVFPLPPSLLNRTTRKWRVDQVFSQICVEAMLSESENTAAYNNNNNNYNNNNTNNLFTYNAQVSIYIFTCVMYMYKPRSSSPWPPYWDFDCTLVYLSIRCTKRIIKC